MWGLWLAVVLAVASAAPQEVINDVVERSDQTTSDSLEDPVTTSYPDTGLEVMNIVNESSFEAPTTTVHLVADEQNETDNELTTSSEVMNILNATDDFENVNSNLNSVPIVIGRITLDYPEELYLPDEDPIDNTIDDTLGSDDIIDVIKNFIAERDPMLQLFLSICFIHPSCYELDSTSSTILSHHSISSSTPLSQKLAIHLSARRTETARNILVKEVMKVQTEIKALMFKYIQEGVGARGVSVLATKTIIDSIKDIWLSLNGDLEYAKSSIQELFYLLPLDTKEQVQAMVDIAEVVQRIPAKTELLLEEATQEGYQQYVRSSSWNSWKRN